MAKSLSPADPGDFLSVLTSGKPGDIIKCKRCGVEFERPFWFFNGLCDDCFALFDEAKMRGRFGQGPITENSDEWMNRADNPRPGAN